MDKNLLFRKLLKVFLKQISMDEGFYPMGSKSLYALKNQFTKLEYTSVEVTYRSIVVI